jgi:hypothetical protein
VAVRAEVTDLQRGLALGVDQRALPVQVTRAPDGESTHYHPQLATSLGEDVFGTGWVLRVKAPGDDAVLLQGPQPSREHIGRDRGQ